jgi:hypothetical protein
MIGLEVVDQGWWEAKVAGLLGEEEGGLCRDVAWMLDCKAGREGVSLYPRLTDLSPHYRL